MKKLSSIFIISTLVFNTMTITFGQDDTKPTTVQSSVKETKKDRTDEKEAIKEMNKKWDALSKSQKEEIYQLEEQQLDLKLQIIEKYESFGILDQETSIQVKEKLTKIKGNLRKNGKIPFMKMLKTNKK